VRTKAFSVTIADCRVDTFTVQGPGGGGKDTSNTGVRITHLASRAVGYCVDTRSQRKNKEIAFTRMAKSHTFTCWCNVKLAEMRTGETIDETVDKMMDPQNLRVECRRNGVWVTEL
jgi:hypothetical protein